MRPPRTSEKESVSPGVVEVGVREGEPRKSLKFIPSALGELLSRVAMTLLRTPGDVRGQLLEGRGADMERC